VVAYTQRLAGRLLPLRIRVNSVSPGPVLTPLFPYFENDAGREQMAWMNEQVGRVAQPDDEAKAITWLAVGDSDFASNSTRSTRTVVSPVFVRKSGPCTPMMSPRSKCVRRE